MKNPRTICKEHNLYSYQAYKGAELMARHITEEVWKIMTTPSDKTVYDQLREYFGMVEKDTTAKEKQEKEYKGKYPRGC